MLTPQEGVHSSVTSGGTRMKSQVVPQSGRPVETFVMSVIKEVATSSPCPSSPPPSPPITSLSQHSQEVIEEALGSLANLIISSAAIAAPNNLSANGAVGSPETNKNGKGGHKTTKKEHHRQNLLLRKQSSLKALTPEDLGRLIDSTTYATTTSQTYLTNASTITETSTVTISHTDHLSTYHLRKPISSYRQPEITEDADHQHPSPDHDDHNTAKAVTREQRSKSNRASEAKTENKRNDKDAYYSSGNKNNNIDRKGLSQSQARLKTEEEQPPQPQQQHHKIRLTTSTSPPTNNISLENKNSDESQSPLGKNDDDDMDDNFCRHGHMCIHHYHHHSHHHHHHYYPTSNDAEQQDEGTGIKNGDEKLGKKYGKQAPTSSTPLPLEHLQDISFYRKFSATSPITRSKSSLAWAELGNGTTGLNVLNLWTKSKRQKSRSTPIKLDLISEPIPFPPPTSLMHYSNRMCGGCVYCSKNELSCNCCCDECCCARQFSQVIENKVDAAVGDEGPGHSSNMRKSSRRTGTGKFSTGNRSRSMDSFIQNGKDEVDEDDDDDGEDDDYGIDIDDEILNNPDAFIDRHLLQHLALSDSEDEVGAGAGDINVSVVDKATGYGPGSHISTNTIIRQVHCDCDNADQVILDHSAKSKSYLSMNELASTDDAEDDADDDNDIPDKNRIIIVNKNGTGSGTEGSFGMAPRSTNIIFVRKPPHGSSSSSKHESGKRERRRRGTLRIANGEIRPSPVSTARPVTTTISSGNQHLHALGRNRNGDDSSPFINSPRRGTASAVMTVTVDSMSLFLDAVHVQMSQE